MKEIDEWKLMFSILEVKIDEYSFLIFEDGDIEFPSNFPEIPYVNVDILKELVEIADEFISKRKSLIDL